MFELTVAACSIDDSTFCSTVPVAVHVRDANDNAPIFEHANYTAKIGLQHEIGENVLTVKAHDADSGALGQVTYFLMG